MVIMFLLGYTYLIHRICEYFVFLYEPYVNDLNDLVSINAYISSVWDKIEALKNGL